MMLMMKMGCRSVADWSEEEDRFLLCWAAEHGVDSPGDDDISLRLAARSTPSLGFYHSMHTRTPAELRRRTVRFFLLLKMICLKFEVFSYYTT